jgi:hypothetical protein
MGITAEDVTAAIELILGRTPEPALVEYHVEMGFIDRTALGRYLVSTDEFKLLNRGEPADLSSSDGRAAAGRDRRRQLKAFGPRASALSSKRSGAFS